MRSQSKCCKTCSHRVSVKKPCRRIWKGATGDDSSGLSKEEVVGEEDAIGSGKETSASGVGEEDTVDEMQARLRRRKIRLVRETIKR